MRRAMVLLVAMLALAFCDSALAEAPAFLFQVPEGQTSPGSGAGELNNPRGVATNPVTGRFYVADLENSRVSEYTAWGLFVKSWGWGVADGASDLQTCGPAEPDESPDPSLCESGTAGDGAGQLNWPIGLAIDPAGNVFVYEHENLRVQKFSPAGQFLLMFGGDVNKTKTDAAAPAAQRNVCTAASGDSCQAGISGEEPSQLSPTVRDHIAYSPAEGGRIVVGDKNGIQVFDLNGNWVKTIPFTGALSAFTGQTVIALDADKAGNIYFSLSGVEDVYKVDSTGLPLAPGQPGASKFEVGTPLGIAVDTEGSVYAVDDPFLIAPHLEARVLKFDLTGKKVIPTEAEEDAGQFFPYIPPRGPAINGIATNICTGSEAPGNLYISLFSAIPPPRSYVEAYGTPPIGCEPPPPNLPEIVDQLASSVGREEATVKARINPRFWPDTTYYVEYGTGKCSDNGCPAKVPVPSALLTNRSLNAPVTTAGVVLGDLEPQTVYHYRFVAESGGGGPVFGIDPDGREGPKEATFEDGLEATFRTMRSARARPACPNDAVRTGASADLPDCRAYEMVSPLDKGNGDVALWEGRSALEPFFFELHQSAPSGNRFTFTSAFAFGDPESAPFVSQYLTDRTSSGWTSKPLSAPRTESPVEATALLAGDFHGFSEDLCQAWIRHYSVAPLAPGAIADYTNLYRQQNCAASPSYEALTSEKPVGRSSSRYFELRTQGFSTDGSHTIFTANGKLHDAAPSLNGEDARELLLYEHTRGDLRFVCHLPDGSVATRPCAAGTVGGSGGGNTSSVHNAISADGSRIFWSSYTGTPGTGDQSGQPGQIYVRIGGTETKKVSTTKGNPGDRAWFWTAADDGSKAIFSFEDGSLADQLYEVDIDTETPTLIAGQVEGPMGASEDASRIYFASKEDLDGPGGPGTAGDRNLYLYDANANGGAGSFTFIMELAAEDIQGTMAEPAPIDELPIQRSARVSRDGLHATFVSSASPTPTGFDTRDANSDLPAQQVYLYDATTNQLRCVSCNDTGARPVGEDIGLGRAFFAAARIQGWEMLLHAPRVLSEDGSRVFFESFEALVPRDTNATWDVYQWEEPGKGTCTEALETFNDVAGGCVDLISSGLSPVKSTFLDADPSGDNVFFSTQSSLVASDYGLNDVYVARVGGGFPEPQAKEECEGEACQSPPPPPPEVTPSSETSHGPGNVIRPKARRCPKGKRRVKRAGKVRCVKRNRGKARANRKANKTRRAGR
jgi:DNA-binding beta-propeller fold protein YncE